MAKKRVRLLGFIVFLLLFSSGFLRLNTLAEEVVGESVGESGESASEVVESVVEVVEESAEEVVGSFEEGVGVEGGDVVGEVLVEGDVVEEPLTIDDILNEGIGGISQEGEEVEEIGGEVSEEVEVLEGGEVVEGGVSDGEIGDSGAEDESVDCMADLTIDDILNDGVGTVSECEEEVLGDVVIDGEDAGVAEVGGADVLGAGEIGEEEAVGGGGEEGIMELTEELLIEKENRQKNAEIIVIQPVNSVETAEEESLNNLINPNALHSCSFESFEVQALEGETKIFQVSLKKSSAEKFFSLKVGDLPSGVEVSFLTDENEDGVLSGTGENSDTVIADVRVNVSVGAQKGSFNVPIFYLESDNYISGDILAGGNVSGTICQFNLITK
jgi:hypothetical protein